MTKHSPTDETTLSAAEVTAITVRLERYRAVAMGIFESYPTFLLMILVRWYSGTPMDKSIIAAAGQGGLLFSPLILFASRRLQLSAPKTLSLLVACSSLAFLVASGTESRQMFVLLTTLGIFLPASATPLMTSIFSSNYPATQRGRLFSQNQAIRIATSIMFGAAAGWFLNGRIQMYYVLMIIFSISLACSAYLAGKIPVVRQPALTAPLFSCFHYLVTDKILRDTTISWMLLGLGNLMMFPLRVEYLANPVYELNLSEMEIALFVSVLPNAARLVGTHIWGRLFDTMNFFSLRMVLNVSFMVGIVSFFMTSSWIMLSLAALIFGFSISGGDVAWSLWVTKFAPEERVADYMAVHTFFTGVRGIIAPGVAFWLLGYLSIQSLSVISAVLICMATLLLLPIKEVARQRTVS